LEGLGYRITAANVDVQKRYGLESIKAIFTGHKTGFTYCMGIATTSYVRTHYYGWPVAGEQGRIQGATGPCSPPQGPETMFCPPPKKEQNKHDRTYGCKNCLCSSQNTAIHSEN